MSTDPIESLIKEIAVKHGIAVSRDDPILVLQTINNRLMQDSSEAQKNQLHQYKEEMEALIARWGGDATHKAERIINDALTASKEAMGQTMRYGAKHTATSIRTEIDASLTRVTATIQDVYRIGILNIIASCIALIAATIALWATFHN